MILNDPRWELSRVEAKQKGDFIVIDATFSIDRQTAKVLFDTLKQHLDAYNKDDPDKDIAWWENIESFMQQMQLFTEGAKA